MATKICHRCDGLGDDPDGGTCRICSGSGELTVVSDLDYEEYYRRDTHSKVEALETKLDALQDDMDIIKPQIQALYNDLNP